MQTGFQNRFVTGIGVAHTSFIGSMHGVYYSDAYASFSFVPAFKTGQQPIYGVKLGADVGGGLMILGTELFYAWQNSVNDFFIIPRIGIGINYVHITYGRSISTTNYRLLMLGKNAFTLVMNIPFKSKDLLAKGKRTN